MQLQFHRRKRRVWQGWTVICIIALLVVLPAGSAKAAGCTNISPLPCSDVLVAFPYQLDFGSDAGKILDGNGVGTGFTMVDPPTNGTGYLPANLAVDTAAGTLKITTTSGIAFKTTDSQDNTLGIGIDAPDHVSVLTTSIVNPPAGTGKYEQAGLWFGNNEDNYVKLVVMSTPTGTKIQHLMEVNGAQTNARNTAVLNLAGATVSLTLRANPSDQTIAASYRVNGGSSRSVGTYTAPAEFFSSDAAGIDPTIGTRSFGGVFTSHRSATSPVTYTFDSFSLTDAAPPPPPPPPGFNFTRSSFAVPQPTSMAFGPDGRLYVTQLLGEIHAIMLDANHQAVADELITILGSRLTLGITVDPASTPSNVILWVAHSSPSLNDGEPNSSTVTRLSGPGFSTRTDVITGLPRAKANHAINSIHFGPDGRLYIAQGGNTGAGAPNTANTEFGDRAEQPLSAALLVADVKAAGFQGSCATPLNTFGIPSTCDVRTYATGLRNAYDFVWHSNGSLYAPDNGLGVIGTFPPSPTPPCTGFASTASWTQGGHNPGAQPDILVRIQQGKYYGHPNPYRNECVFKDGHFQNVAAPADYVPPIYNLGDKKSANGTIEYRGDAFNGALKGSLLIANYSQGDDITRVRLSADGTSVVSAQSLAGGFADPLPLVEGPDGTIYVGEFGGGKVTALVPSAATENLGSWTTRQPMPVAILDAGGTALGGKLYAVAGKTSAGPRTTVYSYDPALNSWATEPSLPAAYPAVENPAVAALNGKLYVFGGSSSAFSGAVTNAAVFDPATSTWTTLPPMPVARGGATAQAVNEKLYVVGGMDASGASLASVSVYDPATGAWSSAASMGTRRDNPGSAVLGGKLYVFGGRTRNADGSTPSGTRATAEMYDPTTNTWTARASMPTGRRTMVVGVLNGRAQVMGGERTSTGGTFPQNEEYDPVANAWRALTPMQTARHGAVGGTINGVVYVAGGGPTGGSSYTNVNEAFSTVGVTSTQPPVTGPTTTTAPPTTAPTTTAAPTTTTLATTTSTEPPTTAPPTTSIEPTTTGPTTTGAEATTTASASP